MAALPVWARAGFQPPDLKMPQVVGVNDAIIGVVFGNPLDVPPVPREGTNKILWLARPHVSNNYGTNHGPDLKIEATFNGTDLEIVRRVPGGPGPSIINMPKPGCWTFDLSWPGHQDRLAVRYYKS